MYIDRSNDPCTQTCLAQQWKLLQGALVECFGEVAADTLPLNTSVPLDISTSGIIWALSVIVGVRLGRTQTESARLDVWSKVQHVLTAICAERDEVHNFQVPQCNMQ